jgi:hypothetical protein
MVVVARVEVEAEMLVATVRVRARASPSRCCRRHCWPSATRVAMAKAVKEEKKMGGEQMVKAEMVGVPIVGNGLTGGGTYHGALPEHPARYPSFPPASGTSQPA